VEDRLRDHCVDSLDPVDRPARHRSRSCHGIVFGRTAASLIDKQTMNSIALPQLGSEGPRRLAAVMIVDIHDYSRLRGPDEDGIATRVVGLHRTVVAPGIGRHHGQLIRTIGDGWLAIFNSPLDAVRCALALQGEGTDSNAAAPSGEGLQFRIGIDLGDIMVASHDIYGDSVNIAARIRDLAGPGGICVSGSVHDQVKNKLACRFLSLGDQTRRNVVDPVRVYRVVAGAAIAPPSRRRTRLILASGTAIALVLSLTGWLASSRFRLGDPELAPTQLAHAAASPTGPAETLTAEQHGEAVYQRMVTAMTNSPFNWRTVERLATVAGVSETEAHDILAAHQPAEVILGMSKDGKLLARLARH